MPTPITMDDVTFYAASKTNTRTGYPYQILYARIIKGLDPSSVIKITLVKATDSSNHNTGYYNSWLTKTVFNGIGFAFICEDNTAVEHIARRIRNLVGLGSLCLDDGTWQNSVSRRLPKSMWQGDSIDYIDVNKSGLIGLKKLGDKQPDNKLESLMEQLYANILNLAIENTLKSNNIKADESFMLDKGSFKKMFQETLEFLCKPALKGIMTRDNKDSRD